MRPFDVEAYKAREVTVRSLLQTIQSDLPQSELDLISSLLKAGELETAVEEMVAFMYDHPSKATAAIWGQLRRLATAFPIDDHFLAMVPAARGDESQL